MCSGGMGPARGRAERGHQVVGSAPGQFKPGVAARGWGQAKARGEFGGVITRKHVGCHVEWCDVCPASEASAIGNQVAPAVWAAAVHGEAVHCCISGDPR